MGKKLYEYSEVSKKLFNMADKIMQFEISKVMFEGSSDDLKQKILNLLFLYFQLLKVY